MSSIKSVKTFSLNERGENNKSKDVKEIFNSTRRKIVQVRLWNGEVLAKHKANEPITVFCVEGRGTFRAGSGLEDEHILVAGTFLTLESAVDHEVIAEPEISLIVTKFKAE